LASYKVIAEVEAGSGETILFWKDLWNGRILKLQYPELHSFAINQDISLAAVRNEVAIQEIFHLPLSEEAYSHFCELKVFMNLLPESQHRDTWKYIWGGKEYSSQKAYRHLIGSSAMHPAFRWI
jgi:hypothetical protein